MLELHLLRELMLREGSRLHIAGKLQGYNLSYIQHDCNIPKATFYRAIKELISQGMIQRTRRGEYAISDSLREISTAIKPFNRSR